MSDVYRALGDPTRRQILELLRRGELTAGEIADHFDLAKPTLSGHFNVLRHAGLITKSRRGTTIIYALNVSVLEEALLVLMKNFGLTGRKAAAPSSTMRRV